MENKIISSINELLKKYEQKISNQFKIIDTNKHRKNPYSEKEKKEINYAKGKHTAYIEMTIDLEKLLKSM